MTNELYTSTEVYPPPLPNIGLYKQAQIIQNQIMQRQAAALQPMPTETALLPNVSFFGDYISLKTINENPLYYSFMLDQENLGLTLDTAENKFIETFFTKTDIVKCDICYDQEIDLDFVKHCKEGYHVSCLKKWIKTNAICPHCHKDCDAFFESHEEQKYDN